jgi:hypothetical protein
MQLVGLHLGLPGRVGVLRKLGAPRGLGSRGRLVVVPAILSAGSLVESGPFDCVHAESVVAALSATPAKKTVNVTLRSNRRPLRRGSHAA